MRKRSAARTPGTALLFYWHFTVPDCSPMDGTACVGGPGNDEQHVCGQCGVLFDTSYPLGAHDFAMP